MTENDFAQIDFDHLHVKQKIRVRKDGKAHVVFSNGCWWCTIGIGYADGVLMWGETPQLAYEAAVELQKIAGKSIVLEGIANAGLTES